MVGSEFADQRPRSPNTTRQLQDALCGTTDTSEQTRSRGRRTGLGTQDGPIRKVRPVSREVPAYPEVAPNFHRLDCTQHRTSSVWSRISLNYLLPLASGCPSEWLASLADAANTPGPISTPTDGSAARRMQSLSGKQSAHLCTKCVPSCSKESNSSTLWP